MGFAARLAGQAGALSAVALLGLPAAAQETCADPREAAAIQGESAFVQTRHLSGVNAPIIASGVAHVSAQEVEWTITDPIDIKTVITASGITQSVEGGPAQPLAPQGGDAFLSAAGLFELLTGDYEAVSARYRIEDAPSGEDGGWSLLMTPRNPGVASVLTHVEVAGCQTIEQVSFSQANGDVMDVAFSHAEGG